MSPPDRPDTTLSLSGTAVIQEKIRNLPAAPGVYRMLNLAGEVLYIGKARNLKKRVASYTRLTQQSNRIARMIHLTHDMEFVRTQSESDALLLEANLIKKLKPRYNILLRDDKSFPYILLARDHEIPQLVKHRGSRTRKGEYFGPFASAGAVNRALNTLQRAFLLRSCSDSVYESRSRPCLLYQIKRCSAPCTAVISKQDYGELVAQAQTFLEGDSRAVQNGLLAKMQSASDTQDFEAAASARDRIHALTYVQSKSPINSSSIHEADIVAIAVEGGQSCVQVFFFRARQNLGNKAFFPRHERTATAFEILEAFLAQFYESHPPPAQILINIDIKARAILSEALSIRADKKIAIHRPQRGDKLSLIAYAEENAREALARHTEARANQKQLLAELCKIFGLPEPPQRIEVFDNSHLQGSNQIGGMIVAGPEGFMKNQYRKFNIKNKDMRPGDDYAMMYEVFTRRYSRLMREESPDDGGAWPDLILIDGGKGHLSTAHNVMHDIGLLDIPLIAIAKGPERNAGREKFFMLGRAPLTLPKNSPALYYLQRLRDEAHRFAIGSHRAKRKQGLRTSSLDAIQGIGAHRKRALLHHFGSASAVERASRAELEKVEGISAKIAHKIYDYYHE